MKRSLKTGKREFGRLPTGGKVLYTFFLFFFFLATLPTRGDYPGTCTSPGAESETHGKQISTRESEILPYFVPKFSL